MDRSLILGLDIGTSSVRAGLFDYAGNIVPKTLIKNERELRRTADGGLEINAKKALAQVVTVIDEILERSSNLDHRITHVATACFWHSLVGVDAKGVPTTEVLSWADNRSREMVPVLRQRFDETAVHNRTGARFHSSFWPAKLLWLRKTQPQEFARTVTWLSLSDHLLLELCDDASTSVSMASATGIFDICESTWDASLLRSLKLKTSNFPTITEKGQTFRLNKSFARRWPQLAEAGWFPAIGDGAANNIGSGCMSRHRAALMVGTSGAMRVAYNGTPPKKIPDGLWCYRIDRDRAIVGGALSDGGGLYNWLKVNLKLPPNAESIIARRPPAAHGLAFLPFVAGERSTGYHENARGAIAGLTASSSSIDITQAAMESIGYRFADVLEQLGGVTNIKEIYASGGALRASKVWTQIISNILGRRLRLVDVSEASLRGAVLLALETIGNIESIEEISPGRGKVFEPDSEHHAAHKRAQKRHRQLYDLIINNR